MSSKQSFERHVQVTVGIPKYGAGALKCLLAGLLSGVQIFNVLEERSKCFVWQPRPSLQAEYP